MNEQPEKRDEVIAPAPKRPQSRRKSPPVAVRGEASIYIGPSLPGGRLPRYTVFKGGALPAHVAALADEHKSIKRLIVPVSQLAEAERRLADRSSIEAADFAAAAKVLSKGGK